MGKILKTWEMIKELTENPKKKFKSGNYNAFVDDGTISVDFCGEETEFVINVSREWEEVKQPVNFMTAINSNKKIKPEYFHGNYMTVYQLMEIFYELEELKVKEYINGKWFIED